MNCNVMETSHIPGNQKISEQIFDSMILRLTRFVSTHHRYPILKDDPKLYGWISAQMHKYKNNSLKSDQRKKLDAIGFIYNRNDYRWHQNASEVKEILTLKPEILSHVDNGPLLIWTKTQFAMLAQGKLSNEKKEILKQIKPLWTKKISQKIKEKERKLEEKGKGKKVKKQKKLPAWDKKFNKLVNFRQENPDTWPSRKSKIEKERKLGVFCFTNQILYSKFALDDYRLEKLQSINFDFVFDRENLKSWLDEKKHDQMGPSIKKDQKRKYPDRKTHKNKIQKRLAEEGEDFFGVDNVTKLYEVMGGNLSGT